MPQYYGEQMALTINATEPIGYLYREKYALLSVLHHTSNHFQSNMDQNVKGCLHDIGVGKDFRRRMQEALDIKENN